VHDRLGTQATHPIEGERLLLRFGKRIADQPAIDATTLEPTRIVALIEERLAKAEPSNNHTACDRCAYPLDAHLAIMRVIAQLSVAGRAWADHDRTPGDGPAR
jgi:hypothetical protein